jgi:Na+/proline symporter
MYEMVQNAYKVTLVGAFVPLVCGIYWRRASTQGALVSSLVGLAVWAICERFFVESDIPPQMWGLFASAVGMVAASCAPQIVRDARQDAFEKT